MAQYIDKDALVAEIERIDKSIGCDRFLSEYEKGCNQGKEEVCDTLRNFLNTLEVKEVELDFQMFAKEMETVFALPYFKTENTEEEPLNWEYAIAKHFFELGLKAKI